MDITNTIFYSITDVARFFNVSRQAVHKWIVEGKLKAYRVGNLYRINKEDVETFIKLKDA